MRRKMTRVAWLPAALLAGTMAGGCAASKPCSTSTADVDRLRAETETSLKQAGQSNEEVKKLQADIASMQQRLDEFEGQPEILKERIEALEKGSGRAD